MGQGDRDGQGEGENEEGKYRGEEWGAGETGEGTRGPGAIL